MPNPAWITSENVKFNGAMDNAAVLNTAANIRSLILWDDLSADDQTILTNFIDNNGGALPLAGPTSGVQTVDFAGSIIGANPTGLNNVVTATAGVATINVGGDKVGGTASGLSAAAGTAGYQVANFLPTITAGTATNLAQTAGYQYINFSALTAGTDSTNLVGGTTYTSTITVDGVAKSISIVGSTAQTFTTLVGEINTDLGASATATLDVPGKRIKIESATLGPSSTVVAVQGTLFAAPLSNFTNISASVAGTGSAAALTATIVVDGVSKAISILPVALTTFADVISEINADLGASATAAIVGGDIKVTSATSGTNSTVVITAGTLFPALPGFNNLLIPSSGGGASRAYSATIIVDDSIKTVNFTGLLGDTFQHVLDELNTDLGASATASLSGGNIIITSSTTGLTSSVKIDDNGFLFASLTGYAGFSYTLSTAPVNYLANIVVDGVNKAISVKGSDAQTFTTLVAEINTDLAASAIAAIVNGNITITSATTGVSSTVSVMDSTLFKTVGAKRFVNPINGVANLLVAANTQKTSTGTSVFDHFNILTVGLKPKLPTTPAALPKTQAFTYFNGTVWKYLVDDTDVNP